MFVTPTDAITLLLFLEEVKYDKIKIGLDSLDMLKQTLA